MRLLLVVVFSVAASWLTLSARSYAEEAPGLLKQVLEEHGKRMEGVDTYVKRIRGGEIPGLREGLPGGAVGPCLANCVVYKVEEVETADGSTLLERALSPLEVQRLAGLTPEAEYFDLLGAGMIDFQQMINDQFGWSWSPGGRQDGGETSGLEGFLAPWNMFYAGGTMLRDVAEGVREADRSLETSADQAQGSADQAGAVMSEAQDLGSEAVNGTPARVFGFDDVNMAMAIAENQTWSLDRGRIWVDPDNLVILKHRFEGVAQADGQSREFFIEVANSDYRRPPGCDDMYEPYRQVVRMGGMLDAAQMAEMEEAQRQLEQFERELASMPPQQRQMVENMMGSQMDTLRSLTSGGAIEHVQETEEILCNPDLAALFGTGMRGQMVEDYDLVLIQEYLVILGYEPGNTDGVLDALTQVAISQFQAEHGLEVTGGPSRSLQQALAGEVG